MDYGVTLPEQFQEKQGRPFVIAHRGNRVQAPENSMAAFRLALAQGAVALETDLRLTRDREIVLMHDDTLDRTTDHSGAVADMTLDEIKQARVTGRGLEAYPQSYPDERVPTLDEFLAEFAEQTYFLLEIKAPAFKNRADVPLLYEALRRHHALDRAIIASFDTGILDGFLAHEHPFVVAPIMAMNWWPPKRYPMLGVWYPWLFANPAYVAICHRRGQIFCPLDPTPEPRLRYYLWLGVDFVLSDDPSVTVPALAALRGE